MTFTGPGNQQTAGMNLFGQAEWARRGEGDAHLASANTRLAALETRRANITTFRLTAGVGSYGTNVYADYPGPLDFTFTKAYAASSIVVTGAAGGFSTSAGNRLDWAVRISGVDYPMGGFFFNTISEHNIAHGVSDVITGLAVGTYVGRVRWKVSSGGGLSTDGNDLVTLAVHEF